MSSDYINRTSERFGSAAFASQRELQAAGLLQGHGIPLGYWQNTPIHLDGDAPLLTVGGAGSGKLRDLLAYPLCTCPRMPMLVLDPRGELAAISMHTLAPAGTFGWVWSPLGNGHSLNPLDILKLDEHLHGLCKFIVEGLIPLSSGGGAGRYFELRSREWLEAIITSLVETNGRVSFVAIAGVINAIESDQHAWASVLERMLASRFESVRRAAAEMLTKQQDTPKEFGSILGEIYAHTSFLNDPGLLAALKDGDLSLSALVDPARPSRIYLNVPAEYLGIWSPLLRVIFTVAMLYKSRHPERPRILMLVDEAGQLGRFEGLLRGFTYARGAGVRCWALFQDLGQIAAHYGFAAIQTFVGSAQVRQFFGVRDLQTAQLVSEMLGVQTLEFDDALAQSTARRQGYNAALKTLLFGEDPFSVGADFAHFARASSNQTRQARPLLTPAEVLALPEDRQLLFISGKNLKPILGWKHAYFSRPEMAGHYLANPFHPPGDSVEIIGPRGPRRARIITGPTPAKYRDFPQYRSGQASWIEGYPL